MKPQPNLVIILLDALRADRLSCLGYTKPTTPHLDALAKKSLLFTNCFSPSSWTVPSHASLFTGALPNIHQANELNPRFPSGIKTLSEILNQKGYRCFHLSNSPFTATGDLAKGSHLLLYRNHPNKLFIKLRGKFSERLNPIYKQVKLLIKGWGLPFDKKENQLIKDATKLSLRSASSQPPFFIFAHFLTTHAPYGFTEKTLGQINRRADIDKIKRIFWNTQFTPQDHFQLSLGLKKTNEEESQALNLIYDAAVRYADEILDKLIKKITKLPNTILLVTSDHGEILGEHTALSGKRIFGHFLPLGYELLHIPLILNYQNLRDKISSPVSLIDILPTLGRLMDFKPPFLCQGKNLLSQQIKKRRLIEAQLIKSPLVYNPNITIAPQACLINQKTAFIYRGQNQIEVRQNPQTRPSQIKYIPSYNYRKLL